MITDGFTYVAVLILLAGGLVTLEKGTGWALFRYLPAVVLVYLISMLLCTFGTWDMAATKPAYGALKNSLTYAMVFTMLLRCDIRKVLKLGPRMLLGFFSASLTIMIGFIVAFLVMKGLIGSDSWMALGVSEADMGYALVVDSIDYSIWVMFLLWLITLAARFNVWNKADTTQLDAVSRSLEEDAKLNTGKITFQSIILLLGVALVVSALGANVGKTLNAAVPFFDKATWTILFITVLGLIGAVSPLGRVAGSAEISNVLLYSVIALLASRASLLELGDAPYWILTGFIILGVHFVLMFFLARLFHLDMFTACVASLANIGGTASAPVLAGTYSGSLVPVGILMALMGYVIGTPFGILVAHIMEMFAG